MSDLIREENVLSEIDYFLDRLDNTMDRQAVKVLFALRAKILLLPEVRIVHCRDCKHQRKQEVRGYRGNMNWIYWCDKEDDISMLGADDQFCSEGERKEDVHDRAVEP